MVTRPCGRLEPWPVALASSSRGRGRALAARGAGRLESWPVALAGQLEPWPVALAGQLEPWPVALAGQLEPWPVALAGRGIGARDGRAPFCDSALARGGDLQSLLEPLLLRRSGRAGRP
jgi:hypothetical protein